MSDLLRIMKDYNNYLLACLIVIMLLGVTGCASFSFRKQPVEAEKNPISVFNTLFLSNRLPLCSSIQPEHCISGLVPAPPSSSVLVNDTYIEQINNWPLWRPERMQIKQALVSRLAASINRRFSRRGLLQWLAKPLPGSDAVGSSTTRLLNDLTRAEMDLLSLAPNWTQLSPNDVRLAQTISSSTPQVIDDFIQLTRDVNRSNDTQVSIGIITTNTAHPYYFGDYYKLLMKQAGAKAVWIPLDAAFVEASRKKQCDALEAYYKKIYGINRIQEQWADMYERQKYYCKNPAILISLMQSTNGLYLAGELDFLTLASFFDDEAKPTPYFTAIKKRFDNQAVVIASESWAASIFFDSSIKIKRQLVEYQAERRSGLIQSSVHRKRSSMLDCPDFVHCTARVGKQKRQTSMRHITDVFSLETSVGRKARFAKLLGKMVDNGSAVGLGVMRDSALIVSSPSKHQIMFKASGSSGVLVFDGTLMDVDDERSQLEVGELQFHLLLDEDSMTYNTATRQTMVTQLGEVQRFGFSVMDNYFSYEDDEIYVPNRFTRWLNRFAQSSIDEHSYEDSYTEIELEKGSNFVYKLRKKSNTVSFTGVQASFNLKKAKD